jgi:hypothetical protein
MTDDGYFQQNWYCIYPREISLHICLDPLIKQCKSATAVTVLHPYIKTVVMIEPENEASHDGEGVQLWRKYYHLCKYISLNHQYRVTSNEHTTFFSHLQTKWHRMWCKFTWCKIYHLFVEQSSNNHIHRTWNSTCPTVT